MEQGLVFVCCGHNNFQSAQLSSAEKNFFLSFHSCVCFRRVFVVPCDLTQDAQSAAHAVKR